MLRLLPLALALAFTPLAQAQTGGIIEDMDSGALLDIVGDGEIIDDDASFGRGRVVELGAMLDVLSESVRRPQVRYRVRGSRTGDTTDLSVRLAETDALRSLSTSGLPGGETFIDAVFVFETVAEWAAWTERAETRSLLAALADGDDAPRTDLDIAR